MLLKCIISHLAVNDYDILFILTQLSVMFVLRILGKNFVRHISVACSHPWLNRRKKSSAYLFRESKPQLKYLYFPGHLDHDNLLFEIMSLNQPTHI
jgi:hypothetical protein